MSTPITDIFNQNKEEKKSNQSSINQIDFAKAFEVGLQQGQDISPTSFSFLLNTVSSKTGKQSTFTFDDASKNAFKEKYGEKQLKQAETLMAQSLMTNNTVNSIASYYAPNRTVNQLYDPEYAMFFPQAKMTSYVKPKDASIEFEWNGMATPITKFTTEEIADVNSVFYDSYAKMFKPLNKDVINKWESDDWSFDKGSFAEGLNSMFGLDKKEGTERVTLMRNEDMAKLDTEDGRRIKAELAVGNLNAKEIFRLQDTDGNFKPVWRTVTQDEDPFDLNNIRSVWGPKTVNNNNIAIEALESFNDSFMSALDGAYFTTYGARKLASPFLSPFVRDSDFNKQLENEYNQYQQWSQGRRSEAAEEESEAWYDNMTNLTKGVANGLGQLISTAGVGFAGKTGVGLLMGASKAAGSKIFTNVLSTMPANIARGFSASYAMGAAQQEARRAGLDENESMLMAGLAGVTLQLSEKMIGGNDSWLYRSFLPKEISSKAGKFIVDRVQAEAKLAGKTIADTMKNGASRSNIMGSTLKWLTEETDTWWKAGVQSFTQEAFQEVTEDSINKLNQFGFNTVADGLKASGYDWINDEARYKLNLRDTLKELGGSFVIGGLTGGITGSATAMFNTQQDIDKQLNGAKMNSLVYHYVDNKGNVQDYYDQLDLLKNNELTGSPYVSSKVDRDSKTRTLWSKLGLSNDTANTKTTETDASKYMFDVMKTEADWVFGQAQKIESQLKSQGINPWENAKRFGQQLTEALDLQPKAVKDVLMIDNKGKILTLDPKTYQDVIKNYSPEELSKLQLNVLSPEAANRTKVDLTTRDIESSVFLEGMSVYNRKNEMQKSLALQLAKRDSNSLFREINPSDVTAFDGNYKGVMVDRELSYEDEFDREYITNFNKLRSKPIEDAKDTIKEQQKLMLEVRDIETEMDELQNKAERYGYDQVAPEVLEELKAEKKIKMARVAKLEGNLNLILNSDLQFTGSEERNSFKTDLRNLVDYENYTDRLADRVKYYESKSQFNRLYNDSTFTQELKNLLKQKGWSPYDYDEDKRKRSSAKNVISKIKNRVDLYRTVVTSKLDSITDSTKAAEVIQTIKDLDWSKLSTDQKSSSLEILQTKSETLKTDLNFINKNSNNFLTSILNDLSKLETLKQLNKDLPNLVSFFDNLSNNDKKTLQEYSKKKLKGFELLDATDNLELDNKQLEEELKQIAQDFREDDERLAELSDFESTLDLLNYLEIVSPYSELDSSFKDKLLLDLINNKPIAPTINNVVNSFNDLNSIENLSKNLNTKGLDEVTFNLDQLDIDLLQDNREGKIVEESILKLQSFLNSTGDDVNPASFKVLVNQLNQIIPRLIYSLESPTLTADVIDLYNSIVSENFTESTLNQYEELKAKLVNGETQETTLLMAAVLLRHELTQIAVRLEEALSKRYLQDINYQRAYVKDKLDDLRLIVTNGNLNPILLDSITSIPVSTELSLESLTGEEKVKDAKVAEYVKSTHDSLIQLIELEKQVHKELNSLKSEDKVKLAKSLVKDLTNEERGVLFRRFDSKGLKYSNDQLDPSNRAERLINYVLTLDRLPEDFYGKIKHLVETNTEKFTINFPQFLSLRQLYGKVVGKTSEEYLTTLSEEVYEANVQLKAEDKPTYLPENKGGKIIKLPISNKAINARGLPGVGKTEYLVKWLIRLLEIGNNGSPNMKILATAPLNNQKDNLKRALGDTASGKIEYLEWEKFKFSNDFTIANQSLIIIDEASLIPTDGRGVAVLNRLLKSNTPVIFYGDELQESDSPVYPLYAKSIDGEPVNSLMERIDTLDTVMRSGNVDIASYLDLVAEYIPIVRDLKRQKELLGEVVSDTEIATIKEKNAKVKRSPKVTQYFSNNGFVQAGLNVTTSEQSFIDQVVSAKNQEKEFKVIIPSTITQNQRKGVVSKLKKKGIAVESLIDTMKIENSDVILSKASQGYSIPNVFVYIPDGLSETEIMQLMSGLFVAASRTQKSLVIKHPETTSTTGSLFNSLLPFSSIPVSSEAKILTYPPFVDENENVSPDTNIRQENFKSFIARVAGESVTQESPSNNTTNSTTTTNSTEEEVEDDTEQDEKEIKTKDQELADWKQGVTDINIAGEINTIKLEDFRNAITNLNVSKNDLTNEEQNNLIKLLNEKLPGFDDSVEELAEDNEDKLMVLYNTLQNPTTAFKGYEYLANNELLQKMMNKKLEQIDDFNKKVKTTTTAPPNSITYKIDGESKNSRTIEEITSSSTSRSVKARQVKFLGFHINAKKEITNNKGESINSIEISLPEQFILETNATETLSEDQIVKLYQKALRNLAGLVQILTTNKDDWKKFTQKVKYVVGGVDMTLEQILDSSDADKLLKEAILDPVTDENKRIRDTDLFKFSTKGIGNSLSTDRQKIVQLVLLSGSPFALSTGIKKSAFTDIDYLDGNLLTDMQNGIRLIQSTTKAKGVKQSTATRYTDDSKPVEKGQGLEVLETIKKIGFDDSILQKAINNKQTPGFTHKRSNC